MIILGGLTSVAPQIFGFGKPGFPLILLACLGLASYFLKLVVGALGEGSIVGIMAVAVVFIAIGTLITLVFGTFNTLLFQLGL